MVSYQRDDFEAFSELYHRYAGRVYGFLKARIPEKAKVDEVFQNIFLKLHQSRHLYDSKFRFAPWLFTICRSVIIDSARTRLIYDDGRWEGIEKAEQIPVADSGSEVGVQVSTEKLSEEQKTMLNLRFEQDLSFEEIAARLKISPEAARQRFSRMIRALRSGHSQKKN